MTVININQPTMTGLVPEHVRESVIEWAGDNDIEVEVLNELLDNLGLEQHAEYVEIEVTVSATIKVRVTSEMAASDVLDKATYEGMNFHLSADGGYVEGVTEVEVEDVHNVTIEDVTATE